MRRSKIVPLWISTAYLRFCCKRFLTVAEAGQISEAARRLHLSQPTVTGHIRRLEANLETTLFIRSANGVSLTERGARLRERAQDVFAEIGEMLREVDQTREVNGTLTLAASTTVARYFVPRIFIRFHHYYPAAALTPKKCWTIFDNSAWGSG